MTWEIWCHNLLANGLLVQKLFHACVCKQHKWMINWHYKYWKSILIFICPLYTFYMVHVSWCQTIALGVAAKGSYVFLIRYPLLIPQRLRSQRDCTSSQGNTPGDAISQLFTIACQVHKSNQYTFNYWMDVKSLWFFIYFVEIWCVPFSPYHPGLLFLRGSFVNLSVSEATMCLYLLGGRTSYCQISWSFLWLDDIMIVSLWNLTGISSALLPRCLSNVRVIIKVWTRISLLRGFTGSYGKTTFRLVNRRLRINCICRSHESIRQPCYIHHRTKHSKTFWLCH